MSLQRKTFAEMLTFTRAGSATYFGPDGLMKTAAADQPRLDYDPATLQPRGLLIEESRTNLLLNSATLATQSVTTTAQSYTLTFYGTGSVALSGTYTGNLAGTGASDRVKLTFTATAGTLTLTVTGSVTSAQLEAGAFATSYIPTTTAAATRAADGCVMTGLNFSRWFNPLEGTTVVEFSTITNGLTNTGAAAYPRVFAFESSAAENMNVSVSGTVGSPIALAVVDGGVSQAKLSIYGNTLGTGAVFRSAVAYKTNDFAHSLNGLAPATGTSGTLPVCDRLSIGNTMGGFHFSGHIRRLRYWPTRLPNARLQELTA